VVASHERIRVSIAAATLVFLATDIVLSAVTRDPWPTNDGISLVVLTAFGTVGYVIARAEPRNPIGWIFLALGLFTVFDYVMRLYLVLDYRQHGGRLPLGHAVTFWRGSWSLFPLILAMPAIVLFPDGRLSRRWRRFMWIYVVAAVVFVTLQVTGQIVPSGSGRIVVDVRGNLANNDGGLAAAIAWLLGTFFFLPAWCSFVGRQIRAWRSATGVRRTQLKWLAAGSAVLLASCVVLVIVGDGSSPGARVAADLATIGIGVLPVAVGVAILRFRLYEIDRLISRTLSYALLTGLLVGVFGGVVLLTTRVLPFSSPVAVAVSTLAAAALFNPLRRRLQRVVDHRFNRARYDRDALVARFAASLRDSVDSDTVVAELAGAAASSVEPAHISVWVRS
jgi:hypothetical protein